MATSVTVTLTVEGLSSTDLTNRLNKGRDRKATVNAFNKLLRGVSAGTIRGKFDYTVGTSVATQTLTCDQASAVATTDEFTLGDVTLSSVAGSPGNNEWELGASDAEMAANIAAAINSSTDLAGLSATASNGVVTVTTNIPGAMGNKVTVTETGNGITVGGATLSGGAGDTPTEFTVGLV